MKSYPSQHTQAIVLKRSNFGEKDRIITLYTQKRGKIATVAKGCRSLQSSRLSNLEPGNLVEAYFIESKGLPILLQVQLVDDFIETKSSLKQIKQLMQVLEVVDKLSVEEENEELFAQLLSILKNLSSGTRHHTTKNQLAALIESLGFQHLDETMYSSISEYVSSLAEKPIRSYEFLTLKQQP